MQTTPPPIGLEAAAAAARNISVRGIPSMNDTYPEVIDVWLAHLQSANAPTALMLYTIHYTIWCCTVHTRWIVKLRHQHALHATDSNALEQGERQQHQQPFGVGTGATRRQSGNVLVVLYN
jgi:hypothetical protein